MSEQIECGDKKCSNIAIWAIITSVLFFVVCIFGEGLGGSLGSNPLCYKYLGCTAGFVGYDAIEHFLFGISAVVVLIWLFKKYSKYSMLHSERWKNIFTLVALVIFLSVLWEFVECAHDVFRANILHEVLVDWNLHINLLNQPTNIDTMGDLFFALVGSIVSLFSVKKEI